MGDSLKLSKDKRHRSSSSLAGVAIEGTRSERKLDIRASIPEVDDQFALAEARCDDLHEKIELVKGLKRKRKIKKRSMTRLSESPVIPDVPFISVRAQPKKKVSHQATRLRQLQMPQNPTRAYVDPARVEQHRMISQVRASQMYREPIHERARKQPVTDLQQVQSRYRRDCADGDSMLGEASRTPHHQEVACEADENNGVDTINMHFDRSQNKRTMDIKKSVNSRLQNIQKTSPKKPVGNQSQAAKWKEPLANTWRLPTTHVPGPRRQQRVHKEPTSNEVHHKLERGSIVELFAKDKGPQKSDTQSRSDQRDDISVEKMKSRVPDHQRFEDQTIDPVESSTSQMKDKVNHRLSRRVKYRSRRYELPTVSSQMKQTGARYYCFSANQTHIPFIVSKSTAPSHNIGVNIQQVLNGIKIQQPLSGIPFTIAHHMGLGHLPFSGKHTNNTQPSLDNREMNVIRLGARLVRLPSYKYMSYNRLLSLYREGDGMVSRFLRAISRPHYFYNSMCNLATREDYDGATSKVHGTNNEAKQSLAEYASLYREYEQLEKLIKDGNYEPELERRRDELARELTAREDHIRKVMQEYRAGDGEQNALRGSASTAADNYRHSTFKLNLGDAHL